MKFFESDWIWDEEIYPNVYTCALVHASGTNFHVFEISDRKNEVEKLLDFMRQIKRKGNRLVGFNSVNFDYPVLHYILNKSRTSISSKKPLCITAKEIYDFGMSLINSQNEEDSKVKGIKDSEVIIPQLDLFLVHHFNNRARATSLKMLEFNMRSERIEDLPFPVGKYLTDTEIDMLIEYNKHDVMEALKFYQYSYESIQLREDLTKQFGSVS